MPEDDAPQPPAWDEVEKHEKFSALTPDQKAQTLQNWVDRVHAYGVASGSWNEDTEKKLNEAVARKAESFFSPAPQTAQALADTAPVAAQVGGGPDEQSKKMIPIQTAWTLPEGQSFSPPLAPALPLTAEQVADANKPIERAPKIGEEPPKMIPGPEPIKPVEVGGYRADVDGMLNSAVGIIQGNGIPQIADQSNPYAQAGASVVNAINGVTAFVASPEGIAISAVGGEFPIVGKAIAAGFAGYMGWQIPGQVKQFNSAQTPSEKVKAGIELGTTLLFTSAAALHAGSATKTPKFTPDQVDVMLKTTDSATLKRAAEDPEFRKTWDYDPKLIDAEITRRGTEAAGNVGATNTAKELETKMVEIQNAPPPIKEPINEPTKPQQVTPTEPGTPPAPQQSGDAPIQAGQPPGASPQPGAKPGGEVPAVEKTTEKIAQPKTELPARTFKTRPPQDDFGGGSSPVSSYVINDLGGLVSKSSASKFQKGNGANWDDAPRLSHPTHNKIYNPKGMTPDKAAQALFDAGLINEPTTQALWNAIKEESKSARGAAKGEGISKGEKQFNDFQKDKKTKGKGEQKIEAEDLKVGDTVTIGTENLKVIEIDPETFDVILEDGKKYGVQMVADGEVIYGIHEKSIPLKEGEMKLPDARKTESQLAEEKRKKDQADAIAEEQNRRLTAPDVEIQQDMLGKESDVPLFDRTKKAPADDWLGATEDLRDEMSGSRVKEDGIPGTIPQQAGKPVGEAGEGPQGESKWSPAPDKSSQAHERITGVPAESAFAEIGYDPAKQWGIKHLADLLSGESPNASGPSYRTDYAANKADYHRAAQIAKDVFLKTKAEVNAAHSDYRGIPSLERLLPRTKQARDLFADSSGRVHIIDQPFGEFSFEGRQSKLSERMKKNLAEKNKTGGINKQILQDLVDYGHRVYQKGMTYAKWSAEMVKQFGKGILNHTHAAWKQITEVYKDSGIHAPKKFTELDRATTDRSLRLQRSFSDAERVQKEVKKSVPDEKRQGAISVWLEANGDTATLQQWAAGAKGKAFKAAAEGALNLTPEELAVATKARGAFDALEAIGNRYGVLGSHRDNYVPHVWEVENKMSGVGSSRLQDKFKFAKARTFNNFFEGDQAGFTPKALAIGKLLPSYLYEMNRVIADREFVRSVSDKTGTDGRPLVIPRGSAEIVDATEYAVMGTGKRAVSVHETEADARAAMRGGERIEKREKVTAIVNPRGFAKAETASGEKIDQSGYKVLSEQPALSGWHWTASDAKGNTVLMKGDLAVHPELVKRISSALGKSAFREWYNEQAKGLAVVPKAIAKNLDTAQSVAKREMFSFLAPFHQVQEGTHAVGHLVNPFYSVPKPDLKLPSTQDAVRHGLMLFPEKGSSQSYMEGVGGNRSFISQAGRKFGGKPGEMLSNIVDGYQDYLFHSYIPGLKIKTYDHIIQRNMERFKGDIASGKVSESDVKALSAVQTNAAYGHLNYALMDRNPTMQHILRLGILAPDFLEARARFVGQALKPSKAGIEQLRAIATLAAIQAASAYLITTIGGDKYDPKHPFEVRHGNRSYFLRSVPEDLMRAFGFLEGEPEVTRQFVSGRINPLTGKIGQLISGRNYRGEATGAMDTMGEMLTNYIPITLRAMPGLRDITKTSKNNPLTPLEQLAGSFGLKVSRYSPITKTYELADKWMEKNGTLKPKGVYPTSKYQGLRYALEDGDMARAKAEYDKLLESSEGRKIAEGFHASIYFPFTGSQASDAKFSSELSDGDKLMFDHAMETKKSILEKFNALPDLQAGTQTEQSAGGSSSSNPFTIKHRSTRKERRR